MKIFYSPTFSTQNLPGPNFFKPSLPGGLRIFRAFASLFLSLPGSRSSSPAPQTRNSSHFPNLKTTFHPRTTSLVQSGRALERPHSAILSSPNPSPAAPEKATPKVKHLADCIGIQPNNQYLQWDPTLQPISFTETTSCFSCCC